MAYVQTVLGTIHPDEMGITTMHEHVGFGVPGWEYDTKWWFDHIRRFEATERDLRDFKLAGGNTFVDCSGIGLGRDAILFANLAKASGVHIVASTGFWADEGILGHFRMKDVDYLTEIFVHEITKGMEHTTIKAGMIKLGIDSFGEKPTPLEEIEFRAGARAAMRTGACITTHGITHAYWQMELFKEERMDPTRVVIGHADAKYAIDLERDKEMLRRGYYVGHDHIGFEDVWSPARYAMPDERRVELVMHLIDAGFVDQLIIANDTSGHALGWPTPIHPY
ncbi:MAG: phosphotriesterase, partial [Chloroflexi bacterium]|nr:phosphotriesterase [Chloroflexota bacterium]